MVFDSIYIKLNTILMKKLITLILVLFSTFVFAQEYDDMYFNRRDRKTVTVVYESNLKHINPEYIVRYTAKPKVRVVVESYHKPYRYSNHWNIRFNYMYGYSWYNPYRWNYGYDPFFDPYYDWYPYGYYPYHRYSMTYSWHRNYYNWYGGWHNPYYYRGGHNYYGHYNYYNNYSYATKTYTTTHKNEVKYQPRTSRSTSYTNNRVTRKTNYSTKQRTVNNSRIRKPVQKRPSYRDTRATQIKRYSRSSNNNYRSNTSRSTQNRSTYSPSRSSGSSRSISTPRSSSGRSSSGSSSRSSSSNSRGRRQ